jgi:arylsulfatase A-like enzyme/Tfp pilus assembly protein PilF
MPGDVLAVTGRPNVLLITIDTLRADRVSCYNPSYVSTPNIDILASRGIIFTRAFCHVPLTLPSHTSLLTGKIPPAHAVRDNGRFRVPAELLTIAEYLKSQGYATGAFIGGYPLHSRFGLNQGFDTYDDRLEDVTGANRELAEVKAEVVASRGLAWLKSASKPWFLWLHFYDPHDPYEPPEPNRTKFKNNPYEGEVAYVDENIGNLLADLNEANLIKNTFIILTADHGESLGDHGESTHGFLTYNPTLWVPLIIAGPGIKPARVEQLVSHIDIFPTICDFLSLPKPAGLEGRSLLPAISGKKLSSRPVYFECLYPYYSRGWAPIQGHIDGRLKFIDSPIPELYDLETDFKEERNQAFKLDLARFRNTQEKLNRESGLKAEQKLDAEAIEKLKTLGYLVGPAAARKKSFSARDDVKVMLPLYEKAMAALRLSSAGKKEQAIEELKQIFKERPDLDVARVNLALIYEASGQLEEARQTLLSALKTLPESYDVFTHTIGHLIAAKKYKEAAAIAESRYLPQMDSDPKIWIDLGLCYRRLGDYPKAQAAYERAAAIDPGYALIHNNLGTLYLAWYLDSRDQSYLIKSVSCFDMAIELDPDYAAAHYGRGLAAYRTGQSDQAITYMNKAISLNPDLVDAFFYLGMSLYREKRFSEALGPLKIYRTRAGPNLSASELKKLDEIINECQRNR